MFYLQLDSICSAGRAVSKLGRAGHSLAFPCTHNPPEFNFCPQSLEISMDARDRQLLSSTPVTDPTVSLIQRSVDLDFVPPLRMPHVGEAEVVLLGPEKWNGVKSFALAYDVARSGLPLTFGDDKVPRPECSHR